MTETNELLSPSTTILEPLPHRWKEIIEAQNDKYKVPGLAVGLIDNGTESAGSFGVLNIRSNEPVRTDSIFQIGSVTKLLTTALATLHLNRRLIPLSHLVSDFLPRSGFGSRSHTTKFQKLQIQELMTHTSGLSGDMFVDTGRNDDCLAKYSDLLSRFGFFSEPGETFSYCNTGFILLGRLTEVIAGRSWDALLRNDLLDPLGMSCTSTLPEQLTGRHIASGHITVEGNLSPTDKRLPRSLGPTGMVSSTVPDLLKYLNAFIGRTRPRQNINPELTDAIRVTGDSIRVPWSAACSSWVNGWRQHDVGDSEVYSHEGEMVGQFSLVAAEPSTGKGLVVLGNGTGTLALAEELAADLFGREYLLNSIRSSNPDVDERIYGQYFRRSGIVEIFQIDGVPHMRYGSRSTRVLGGDFQPVRLEPLARNQFTYISRESGPNRRLMLLDRPDEKPLLYLGPRAFARY